MTKADGLPDKRKLKGAERKKSTPTDKNGKILKFPKYKNCKMSVYVPDCKRYKTAQIEIGSWITSPLYTNETIFHYELTTTKRKIKQKIRELKQPLLFMGDPAIVAFKTGVLEHRRKAIQYMTVDIVIYIQPHAIFIRKALWNILLKFSREVVDIIKENQSFTICHNGKIEERSKNRALKNNE